jgi:2-polyprenyl-3-methyl-5-hydroxy-6-metoxy-1,4-benzoquinol methylase
MRDKINARILYGNMSKEIIPCGLCGSDQFLKISDKDRYGMGLVTVLCKNCGFIFTNPRPTQEAIHEFYKTTYREFYTGNPEPKKEHLDGLNVLKRQWLYNRVKPLLEARGLKAPWILDVGCGSGVLLSVFKRNLPQSKLYGVEPFKFYGQYAAEKNKAEVYFGDFDSFVKDRSDLTGSFDLISLYHVLEHLYDPVKKLLKLRTFLKPEGIVLVQVPNALSPHWQNLTEMCHIAHVSHFSPSKLKMAFELSGFKVIKTFAGQHPGNPRAMTFLCQKADAIVSSEAIASIPEHELKSILVLIRERAHAGKKQKKNKNYFVGLASDYRHYGAYYAMNTILRSLKKSQQKYVSLASKLYRKFYGLIFVPLIQCCDHWEQQAAFRKLIEDQKILIIGSGPSAQELTGIPDDVKVLTCNAGLRLFVNKNFDRRVDLFLCRRKAMIEDYPDIEELLCQVKTNLFLMDDLNYTKGLKKLEGAYLQLIRDHQKDNHYLRRLLRPNTILDIKVDEVTWTSAGIRLLQYALYFKAKEIYLIGIDLNHNGYFWGEKRQYQHTGAKIRHKHPIDLNFLKFVSNKYKNVYSLSKTSPILKYLPFKDFHEPVSIEHANQI